LSLSSTIHIAYCNTVFAIACFQAIAILSFIGYLRYQHRLRAIARLQELLELDEGEFVYEGVEKGEAQRKNRLAVVQRMHRVGLCGGVLPNPQEWWELVNNHFKHGLAVAGDLSDDNQKELLAEILARKFEAQKARADEELEKRTVILDEMAEKESKE
jgi:hypothetical protein